MSIRTGFTWRINFNPRPPRGGRLYSPVMPAVAPAFQSTPSARRATVAERCELRLRKISIHALREEGDRLLYV